MTKTNFEQFTTEDRRLTLLRVLLQSPAYAANEFLIRMALDDFAHSISTDQLRTDLAWLQEQGLLHVGTTADVQIATLSTRGQDVAEGRAIVPGVKRPRAGM